MRLNYFNFKEFEGKFLLTNDLGSHLFVSQEDFKRIIKNDIESDSQLEKHLLEKNIIYGETNLQYSSFLKHDMHRIKGHVAMSTSLHIFVVTTDCNMCCVYCQANNGATCSSLYMNKEIARKSVDVALQSPARYLNFEFQGGEPLLNFETVKFIVDYTEVHKEKHEIKYNLVSNLTLITDEMLDFFQEHNFGISTSIDGPEMIHNANRPFQDGTGTFDKVVDSVRRTRERGIHVGAIQTTTRETLLYPIESVRAYKELGFESIFIRPLTPLGRATHNWDKVGYSPEEFLTFYTQALDEMIQINRIERFLKEDHAAILLCKISGMSINYMELRSPCGASIGQLAYYADGDVFSCDEGRMLHEMGDQTFRLGSVSENTFAEIINNGVCKTVCASSILETIPSCCDCVYQPYCGTCPVVNYAHSRDIIEKVPRGYRCKIYSGMLDYLFKLMLDGNENVIEILKTWSS